LKLVDAFGRKIDYLRISITDHCNLKCVYCTPFFGRSQLPRPEILSYEELHRVAEAAVAAGISKIRITGGEPLVRKGVVQLCRMLSAIRGVKSLALTTNGVLLADMAQSLYHAGVRRINVSIDTLKPDRFERITGYNLLARVLAGIKTAEAIGMDPVKINTVVMRGINDDEVEDLARLTLRKPYHVRFIELMPTEGWTAAEHQARFVPIDEIMKKIQQLGDIQIEAAADSHGPARLCRLAGARGRVGFIAPLSWHFCGACNRLRLTADGKLRVCLFSREEVDIKGPLRAGASRSELEDIFRQAVTQKPKGHRLNDADAQRAFGRAMSAIGG